MQSHRFGAYIAYFERLAAEHKLIKHRPGEKHFFRFEFDEVLSGLPYKINYPALILEGYSFEFVDNLSDNPVKKRNSAFILLDHVPDIGNYNDMHRIWDKLEEIGDDILARIYTEKRKPISPIRDFSITSVEGTLIAVEHNNLRGIRYTFTIDSNFSKDMDTRRWSFLYNLKWSKPVCVKQGPDTFLAWDHPVCVKIDAQYHLAWENHVCTKMDAEYHLVWDEPVCVKVDEETIVITTLAWSVPVCVKEDEKIITTALAWSMPVCVKEDEESITTVLAWSNSVCVKVAQGEICYGYLYNIEAVTDLRGIAPQDYHVATIAEWQALVQACGGDSEVAGSKLKSENIIPDHPGWRQGPYPATNDFGLSLIPSEEYFDEGYYIAVNADGEPSMKKYVPHAQNEILREENIITGEFLAVRCVRDSLTGYTEGEVVTDYDGNKYDTVQIGNLVWTVQNLATTHYNNGDPLGTDKRPPDGLGALVFKS